MALTLLNKDYNIKTRNAIYKLKVHPKNGNFILSLAFQMEQWCSGWEICKKKDSKAWSF